MICPQIGYLHWSSYAKPSNKIGLKYQNKNVILASGGWSKQKIIKQKFDFFLKKRHFGANNFLLLKICIFFQKIAICILNELVWP